MNFDFRTKLVLTLVIGTVCVEGSFAHSYPHLGPVLCLFPYLLGALDRKWSFVLKGTLSSAVAYGATLYLQGEGFFSLCFNLYAGIVLRILPGVMMGYYAITTTTLSDLVCALKKWHMPNGILIPVSVMFRFFYSIKEDYGKIKEAMWMHGMGKRDLLTKPAEYLEYRFMPLLMITSSTADHVAISAMTRGMTEDSNRSSISTTRIRFFDVALLAFAFVVIGLAVRSRYAGI